MGSKRKAKAKLDVYLRYYAKVYPEPRRAVFGAGFYRRFNRYQRICVKRQWDQMLNEEF